MAKTGVQVVGDIAILKPKGKLMGGPETVAIHDKVREIIAQNVKVDDVLTITKLNTIFETFDSVEKAITSFKPEGSHVRS